MPINLNICFECSKEPSHWDGSFKYPQQCLDWARPKLLYGIFCIDDNDYYIYATTLFVYD